MALNQPLLNRFGSPIFICRFLQVVDAIYDCKSEVIGPGFFRFKAEIGNLNIFSYL